MKPTEEIRFAPEALQPGMVMDEKKNSFLSPEALDILLLGIAALNDLIQNFKTAPPPPPLAQIPEFMRLYERLADTKNTLQAFSDGRLEVKVNHRGTLAGFLKNIQSYLRHLSWQFNNLAEGDLSQRVDYLGDFSEAFNKMTDGLNRYQDDLKKKQAQLTDLTKSLQKEIHQKNAVEEALRASENTYRQLALRDPLTGIYNRGYFFEIAVREVENLKRSPGNFCLIMMDVDHFKQFNDTYGHLNGDAALKHVTSVIGGALRKQDLLARYGGEEFIALLAGSTLETGLEIARRIRLTVAENPVETSQGPVHITLSLGVTSLDQVKAGQVKSADTVLNNAIMDADASLYAAKESGRNRVCWRDGSMNQTFILKGGQNVL